MRWEEEGMGRRAKEREGDEGEGEEIEGKREGDRRQGVEQILFRDWAQYENSLFRLGPRPEH